MKIIESIIFLTDLSIFIQSVILYLKISAFCISIINKTNHCFIDFIEGLYINYEKLVK